MSVSIINPTELLLHNTVASSQSMEAWGKARSLRYLFWYAKLREATPAYIGMGYRAGEELQEGFRFFEIDYGEENTRMPHPLRGS